MGAVTARCAVTEGLVQFWCGETTLSVNRRRAGVEARPYGASGEVCAWNRCRRSSDGSAPRTVRPTRRNVTFSNKPTPSVIQRKGRRGRRPLRVVRVGRFQRSREAGGKLGYSFQHPLRCMPRRSFCCRPVGRTVLGAPRSSDRRGGLAADVQRDQPLPRLIRCARLASITQRMQYRGHSPRTISHWRTEVVRHPNPGRAWKPSPTA